jgi:hypothetical protein
VGETVGTIVGPDVGDDVGEVVVLLVGESVVRLSIKPCPNTTSSPISLSLVNLSNGIDFKDDATPLIADCSLAWRAAWENSDHGKVMRATYKAENRRRIRKRIQQYFSGPTWSDPPSPPLLPPTRYAYPSYAHQQHPLY